MNELAIKRDDDDDVLIMWNACEWKGAQVVSFLISTQFVLYCARRARGMYRGNIHMDLTSNSYDTVQV